MYKEKVKRVRDPSLPPPPNLFSQGKQIRETIATIETLQAMVLSQREELALLRRKIAQSDYRIDLLTNIVRRKDK
jgi:hypothetical protein